MTTLGQIRRLSVARRSVVAVVVLVAAFAGSAAAGPSSARAAPSVRVVTVAELDQPVGFTVTPGGRIIYLERASGEIRRLNRRTGRDRLLHRIGGVNSAGERGALGVALHPRWPSVPLLYVYITRAPVGGALRNQVLRFRIVGHRALQRRLLLESPVGSRTNHNGGRLAFGPDGKLYIVIGDGGSDPGTAQQLTGEPRGKILRMDPDGSVPATNPFGSLVWSFGHRNSIGFAFDPDTGRLWESENGPECNDELNRIVAGANFAWGPSQSCGQPAVPADTNRDGPDPRVLPEWTFAAPVAATGVAFCEGCGLGTAYEGELFMGCANGTCKDTVGPVAHVALGAGRWSLDGPPLRVPLLGYDRAVYSMEVAPNGSIYFSDAAAIYRLAPG
ncbi:MAG: PQQ-dependent sugar dehydrogenase [Actinomycetota bacterium]